MEAIRSDISKIESPYKPQFYSYIDSNPVSWREQESYSQSLNIHQQINSIGM